VLFSLISPVRLYQSVSSVQWPATSGLWSQPEDRKSSPHFPSGRWARTADTQGDGDGIMVALPRLLFGVPLCLVPSQCLSFPAQPQLRWTDLQGSAVHSGVLPYWIIIQTAPLLIQLKNCASTAALRTLCSYQYPAAWPLSQGLIPLGWMVHPLAPQVTPEQADSTAIVRQST
jgi:hypothetical protein